MFIISSSLPVILWSVAEKFAAIKKRDIRSMCSVSIIYPNEGTKAMSGALRVTEMHFIEQQLNHIVVDYPYTTHRQDQIVFEILHFSIQHQQN